MDERSRVLDVEHVVMQVRFDEFQEIGDDAQPRRRRLRKVKIPILLEEPQEQMIEIAQQPAALHADRIER